MQKWEHCLLVGKTVKVLGKTLFKKEWKLTEHGAWNELGEDGWQLVSIVPITDESGQTDLHFYFKRPMPEKK